ncbi:hypothetical protein FANTH_4301 [Fusarium anthophilum]|uniref:Shwachman-bodian-diamond syndrome n=3 Tax=Fusarium fujikuroi species complex TaxID=171627 RepID=A0A8H5N2R5_9HYPO|nr:hypothetical protein FANTH_4301 [Fusarium anthophilum]KAF5549445.1 shwachman-bodian-diamond syndrome [Fusarium mexicanum]KAF5673969.1 shwachman-bodian-diamond syndrome [Fusarium circinatum]KAF5986937.1 RNA binding protein [Fusarium bulbicola]
MARGETQQTKVHYKGSDDFIIFIDDVETYQKWKSDKSIPLAHFISSFKIFLTHNQGVQGSLDSASKAALENEFGTSVDDDVIKQILEKGETQSVEFPERQGPKNDSKGPMVSH